MPTPTRADRIIACAEAAAKQQHPEEARDRLAYLAGWLGGEIKGLCSELAQYDSPTDLQQYSVMLRGRIPVIVGADLDQDERGDPVYVSQFDCHLNGIDIGEMLSAEDEEQIRSEVVRQYMAACRDSETDAAVERWMDREAA